MPEGGVITSPGLAPLVIADGSLSRAQFSLVQSGLRTQPPESTALDSGRRTATATTTATGSGQRDSGHRGEGEGDGGSAGDMASGGILFYTHNTDHVRSAFHRPRRAAVR